MLREAVVTGVLVVALCGAATAGNYSGGKITKVDGNKVTFRPLAALQEAGEPAPHRGIVTLPVADDVIVGMAKWDPKAEEYKSGDELEGGLKNKLFAKPPKEGIFTWKIRTDKDDKVIKEIYVHDRREMLERIKERISRKKKGNNKGQ